MCAVDFVIIYTCHCCQCPYLYIRDCCCARRHTYIHAHLLTAPINTCCHFLYTICRFMTHCFARLYFVVSLLLFLLLSTVKRRLLFPFGFVGLPVSARNLFLSIFLLLYRNIALQIFQNPYHYRRSANCTLFIKILSKQNY